MHLKTKPSIGLTKVLFNAVFFSLGSKIETINLVKDDVLNSFIEPLAYVYKGDPDFSRILEDAILKILKIILDSELPIVGSPAYTLEWGKPNSKVRLEKMKNTLLGLCANKDSSYKQAISHWKEDYKVISKWTL